MSEDGASASGASASGASASGVSASGVSASVEEARAITSAALGSASATISDIDIRLQNRLIHHPHSTLFNVRSVILSRCTHPVHHSRPSGAVDTRRGLTLYVRI